MNKIVFLLCVLIVSSLVLRGQEFTKLLSFEVCTDHELLEVMSKEKTKYSAFDTMNYQELDNTARLLKDKPYFNLRYSDFDSINSACLTLMSAFAVEYYIELGWDPYYDYKNEICGRDVVWHPVPEPCFQKGMLSQIRGLHYINGFKKYMYNQMTHEELSKLVYDVLHGGILGQPKVIMDVLLNFDFDKASRDANERRR